MERLSLRPSRLLRYIGFAIGVALMVMGAVVMISMIVPGETFIPGLMGAGAAFFLIGLAYWQLYASSRIVLEEGVLSRKVYGITLWRISISQASASLGPDPGRRGAYIMNVLRVHDRVSNKLVGVFPYKQLHPDDAARLLRALRLSPKV